MVLSILSSLAVPAAMVLALWALVYLVSWTIRVAGRILIATVMAILVLALIRTLHPEVGEAWVGEMQAFAEIAADWVVSFWEFARTFLDWLTNP